MQALLVRCREMLSGGVEMDAVLRLLREEGCSITESIKAVLDLTGAPLAHAKHLVHSSAVWADTFEARERFHDLLEESTRDVDDP